MEELFNEYPIFCDDTSWVWKFLEDSVPHSIKLSTSTSLRESWTKFHNTPRIIIHWEGVHRRGGALIEEILDIKREYDVANRIIVITTEPSREDIIYLGELGVKRILRIRHRDEELRNAKKQLIKHVEEDNTPSALDVVWKKIEKATLQLSVESPPAARQKIENTLERLKQKTGGPSAKYYDAKALLAKQLSQPIKAEDFWLKAIESNPNYFPAYDHLIDFYEERGDHDAALRLLQNLHTKNNSCIRRYVQIGDVFKNKDEVKKAEHYYSEALERDKFCSGALNGLAEIKFDQGELEESRELLSKTTLAYKFAQKLNFRGIGLVKEKRYAEALDHYTRAQYVIPDQEKGALIFYNIGLCYSKWGRFDIAKEFLKIATIKEPNYKKAFDLLEKIATIPVAA